MTQLHLTWLTAKGKGGNWKGEDRKVRERSERRGEKGEGGTVLFLALGDRMASGERGGRAKGWKGQDGF